MVFIKALLNGMQKAPNYENVEFNQYKGDNVQPQKLVLLLHEMRNINSRMGNLEQRVTSKPVPVYPPSSSLNYYPTNTERTATPQALPPYPT